MVTACCGADGRCWAAQSWQQPLPELGFTPWTPALSAYWLELSHWSGDLPKLEVQTGWVYDGRFQNVFGRYTYGGPGVVGGQKKPSRPAKGRSRVLLPLEPYQNDLRAARARSSPCIPPNTPRLVRWRFVLPRP